MGRIIKLADEIVRVLNDATFSPVVVAMREWRPVFTLEEFKGLKVSVVPKAQEMSMENRTSARHNIEIDIGVQKKVGRPALIADVDVLMDLVDAIVDKIRTTGTFLDGVWIGSENVPIFDSDHLGQEGLFTSVITSTFRVVAG